MEKKTCSRCRKVLSVECFYVKRGEPRSWCKVCHKADGAARFQSDKQKSYDRQARRKDTRRELVNRLKNKPCVDCGGRFPPCVMDFDHRDSAKKVMCVSQAVVRTLNIPALLKEVAKCDLVCSNCHRIRTHRRMKRKETGIAQDDTLRAWPEATDRIQRNINKRKP